MTRFILVSGGVMSGVGKGVITASLGKIIKEHGYKTTLIKIDPYINFDAGTLRPTEHGEVWVTEDGGEIDQDLGTYERFLDENILKKNHFTTGQIYKAVIDRERRGDYLGQTVQFIPHIVEEIKRRILQAAEGFDIVIIELGGTVGDYENTPYLFCLKSLERELGADHVAYVLVTYLPVPHHIQEMKTKPTQQAIRLLGQEGIHPDFIICRASQTIDDVRKKKIEIFSHVPSSHIISAPDLENIYQMPLHLEEQKLGQKMLAHLNLESKKAPEWTKWQQLVKTMTQPKVKINIALVCKYLDVGDFSLIDSYVSIYQALMHAGAQLDVGMNISWINAQDFENNPAQLKNLSSFDGVVVPGGFGSAGVEGKIKAIEYVRTHNIPYLGLCYGMQLAVVEFARHVAGFADAHTTEVNQSTLYPVIDLIEDQRTTLAQKEYGASMRLGSYGALLMENSLVHKLYQQRQRLNEQWFMGVRKIKVFERHRHRYEVNPAYVPALEQHGAVFSGYFERTDGTRLMEYFELPHHPFFIGTQAHPEFKSRLGNPSPLFFGFMSAALECHTRKEVMPQIVAPGFTQMQL